MAQIEIGQTDIMSDRVAKGDRENESLVSGRCGDMQRSGGYKAPQANEHRAAQRRAGQGRTGRDGCLSNKLRTGQSVCLSVCVSVYMSVSDAAVCAVVCRCTVRGVAEPGKAGLLEILYCNSPAP